MVKEPDMIIQIPSLFKEKLLFYVTAFFLLLGISSAFSFLFLVPFIIEPAYTTIKMDFDEEPAYCVTASIKSKRGLSNCTWTSCREGCTREVYECTQILVNYMHPNLPDMFAQVTRNLEEVIVDSENNVPNYNRYQDLMETGEPVDEDFVVIKNDIKGDKLETKRTKWFYGARLFPNVKGCGYPPYLNCTVFNNTYERVSTNYNCYFSRANPSLVVSELDMKRVHMNLTCALVLPVVSFFVSVIYLIVAYFYIYTPSLKDMALVSEKSMAQCKKISNTVSLCAPSTSSQNIIHAMPLVLSTPLLPPTSDILTPASNVFQDNVESLNQQLKYSMVDSMLNQDSLDSLVFNYSSSINGNLNKMMTTCISTPPGPIAQI